MEKEGNTLEESERYKESERKVNKSGKISEIIKSVILWIFITPVLVVVVDSVAGDSMAVNYLNGLLQFFIGGFLIGFYKLPKNFIFLAFILPGLANLYFLIYGVTNSSKKQEDASG